VRQFERARQTAEDRLEARPDMRFIFFNRRPRHSYERSRSEQQHRKRVLARFRERIPARDFC